MDVADGWDSEEQPIGLPLGFPNPLKKGDKPVPPPKVDPIPAPKANPIPAKEEEVPSADEAADRILSVDNDQVSQPQKLVDPDGLLNHSFQKKLFDQLLDSNNNILNVINGIFKDKSKEYFGIPLNICDGELSDAQKETMKNAIYASWIDVNPTDRLDSVIVSIRVHNFCRFSRQAAKNVSGMFTRLAAQWGGAPFVCALLGDTQTITATVELSLTPKGLGVNIAQASSEESKRLLRAALVVLNKLSILPAIVPYKTILGELEEYWNPNYKPKKKQTKVECS